MTAGLDARPKCRHCGAPMDPGAALRVMPTDGRPVFYVHRPTVVVGCTTTAGRSPIAVADPVAAAAFDRRTSTTTPALEAPR